MTETQSSQSSHEREQSNEHVEHAVDGLVEVGKLWASQGLRIGRSALETSAQTLQKTSEALEHLATAFERRR